MNTENNNGQVRESVCRLRTETDAVDYHCAWCSKKIGGYATVCGTLREPGVSVDKYDRIYCSSECSTKAFMHPSRDYEARGDY